MRTLRKKTLLEALRAGDQTPAEACPSPSCSPVREQHPGWQTGSRENPRDARWTCTCPTASYLRVAGLWGNELGNASDHHEMRRVPQPWFLPFSAVFPCGKKAVTSPRRPIGRWPVGTSWREARPQGLVCPGRAFSDDSVGFHPVPGEVGDVSTPRSCKFPLVHLLVYIWGEVFFL